MPASGMAAHPMQMFMVAPMGGPVLMPQLQDSMSAGMMMGYGAAPSNFTGAPYAWSAEGAWPYMGESFLPEEAPQQLPMSTADQQAWSAEQAGFWAAQTWPIDTAHLELQGQNQSKHSTEEVPPQVQMDSMMWQAQSKRMPQQNATLRHRRGQRAQESHGAAKDQTNCDEQQTDADSAAEARQMADRLLEQFRAGGTSQSLALASFERMAFTSKTSSRAAQMVLDDGPAAAAFADCLRGHVRSAVQNKHANHVVAKIMEKLPVGRVSFVVDELKGFGQEIAKSCFGCRVLCRILEHFDLTTLQLLEEILSDLSELCNHPFASFVVRHLLEFGAPEHKHRVADALRSDVFGFAKDKFGSHVVEATLKYASLEDQQVLAKELLGNKEQLMVLAANQFGRHVVRALLALPGALKKEAFDVLHPMEDQLKASRYGKSVLQSLRAATSA